MADILNQKLLTGIVILLLLLSILCQIIIGILYQNMIKETDNMATTENKLLKQCKLKFTNCYELHAGVTNIPVFVEKFLNRVRFWGLSFTALGHLSGQFMLLSVFVAGVGICKGIIEGNSLGTLLPYYVVSLFGLYLYFSVSSLVDGASKKKVLKTNIIDYLENNMQGRLQNTSQSEENNKQIAGSDIIRKNKSQLGKDSLTKTDEQELEELLREFLT